MKKLLIILFCLFCFTPARGQGIVAGVPVKWVNTVPSTCNAQDKTRVLVYKYSALAGLYRCESGTYTLVGGGAAIGGAVTGGTSGSVLYVNSLGQMAQDNANIFYNSATKSLGIGTNSFTAPNSGTNALAVNGAIELKGDAVVTATSISRSADGVLIVGGATNGVRINNSVNNIELWRITNSGNMLLGSSNNGAKSQITINSPTQVAQTTQLAASQTADAHQYQNAAGTILTAFDSSANLRVTLTTPASSSETCTAGTIKFDASYIYVCTATNTYKRAALANF